MNVKIIQSHPKEKNSELLKLFGAWKDTPLDSDAFWKRVRTRKSRKKSGYLHLKS